MVTRQQDYAPSHRWIRTLAICRQMCLISLNCQNWPSNLSDLSPVDYSFWGALQQLVYRQKFKNINHSKQVLNRGVATGVVYRYIYPPKIRLSKLFYGVTMTSVCITYCETQWVLKFYTSPKILYLPKTDFWLRPWSWTVAGATIGHEVINCATGQWFKQLLLVVYSHSEHTKHRLR